MLGGRDGQTGVEMMTRAGSQLDLGALPIARGSTHPPSKAMQGLGIGQPSLPTAIEAVQIPTSAIDDTGFARRAIR